MYYRRRPPPLPQRTFTVQLESGHLLVSATQLMVGIHHVPNGQSEPDYSIRLWLVDNPDLAQLYHPKMGWDLPALVGLLWRKIDVFNTLNLRGVDIAKELGIDTVSIPSQSKKRQEKRSEEQSMKLIQEFVLEHPNCTRLEIARGIDRSKNPYLLLQIEWLVLHGVLARTVNYRPNGAPEYRYIFLGKSDD